MFQLGLFSSYVPYMTLALMYVLYLGIHSYNKLHAESEQDFDDQHVEKTISLETDSNQQAKPETIILLTNLSPATVDSNNDGYLSPPVLTDFYPPEILNHFPEHICFSLFSRPPPNIS